MSDFNDPSMTGEAQEEKKTKKKPFEKKMAIPTKTQINFAYVDVTPMKLSVLIPGIVLIILGASLLSKFFVVDRIMEVSRLQSEVTSLQEQIATEQAAIDEMGDLATQYAHYTWSGMTTDERALATRMEAVALIKKYVLKKASVTGYTISGNEISLPITGVSFNDIGRIAGSLEEDPLVDHVEVIAAASDDGRIAFSGEMAGVTGQRDDMEATAQVTIYLVDKAGEVQQ
ncbi:MAG: hypothetical protein K6B14_01020 [Lachnospiraceae bacterium]|nr:hypothetical protein [Lachnospiraceae bacterium]